MCLGPLMPTNFLPFGGSSGPAPAIYQITEAPRPDIANYAMFGQLFEKNLKRRRKNAKTSPLGLEDEETQKKQLTGE